MNFRVVVGHGLIQVVTISPLLLEQLNPRSQFITFILENLLLYSNRLDHLYRSFNLSIGFSLNKILFATTKLAADLFVYKVQLSLCPGYFLNELTFVITCLSNHLPTQVLDLGCHATFNRLSFSTHDIAPNCIQLIEDLWHSNFRQLTLKFFFYQHNCSDCLSRNPITIALNCFSFGSSWHSISRGDSPLLICRERWSLNAFDTL